jgi:gliding motility-associated protein GldL
MAKNRKFRIGINTLISWGASVVIIGLMFKILYLPGGEWMIGVGLAVEAVLFFILGFQADSDEPEPAAVYTAETAGNAAALDRMLQDAQITPDLISRLGDGLRTFSDKVSAISSVADSSLATAQFTEQVKAASGSFNRLNEVFEKASADLAGIGDSNVDAKAYHEQMNKLANNLQELNVVYELELRDSSRHLKSLSSHYESLANTLQQFEESAQNTRQFKQEMDQLAKNIASLNTVYGNMLAAMNQPRA